MARSGREDLARRIHRTRNLATIAALANDGELCRWLDSVGLSAVEAAMIQPSYGGRPYDAQDNTEDAYAATTIAATGVNGGLIAWNLLTTRTGSSVVPGVLGVTAGFAQTMVGVIGAAIENRGEHHVESPHVATNFVVGTVSAALGMRSLLHARRARRMETAARCTGTTWSLAAWSPHVADAGIRFGLRF